MIGKYDTDNVAALRRLVAGGANAAFTREILVPATSCPGILYRKRQQPKWRRSTNPAEIPRSEHQWFPGQRTAQFEQLHAVAEKT